jgi:hypothetical protein
MPALAKRKPKVPTAMQLASLILQVQILPHPTLSPLVGFYRPAISNKYLLSGVCHRDLQPIPSSGVSPTTRGNTFR